MSYARANQSPGAIPLPLFIAGIAALALSTGASLYLVLAHVSGLHLLGCGPGSQCDEAARSVWGAIPITARFAWPVSFLGFAYFAAALVAWAASYGGVSVHLRYIARLAALVSLGFIVLIVFAGYRCNFCIASHTGNFAFWVFMELASTKARTSSRNPAVAFLVVWLVATATLLVTELRTKQAVDAKQESDLAQSTAEIIAATTQKAAQAQAPTAQIKAPAEQIQAPASPGQTLTAQAAASATPTTGPAAASTPPPRPWQGAFRGRYLYGPEKSPVRLVMYTDYQCTDCNRIEKEVRAMLQERQGVSLSIKQFPMCTDCNPDVGYNMHANACWAARAAEAAGILYGNDGFWKMHFWLFDRAGSFTDAELNAGLQQLGFDRVQFLNVMQSDQTLNLVKQDIQEGRWLGLHFTPMTFINGVELRGVFAQGAIPRAVAAVAAKNPPPMGHEVDQPAYALEKYVGDWRESPQVTMPPDQSAWPNGADTAKVKIVVWGDYEEDGSATLDRIITKAMAGRTDVQYTFRHYPFNKVCNTTLGDTAPIHPNACRMHQAAEAAGRLGGAAAYWKMHEWLMTNWKQYSDDALRQAAGGMGLNVDALLATMGSPEVAAAIAEDIQAGRNLLWRSGIPTIYVNGRNVPWWRLEGQPVIETIITEAAKQQ
jgi:protein-disulfide isomerase